VLDRDGHVAHQPAQVIRQAIQRRDDHFLEPIGSTSITSPIVAHRVAVADVRRRGCRPPGTAGGHMIVEAKDMAGRVVRRDTWTWSPVLRHRDDATRSSADVRAAVIIVGCGSFQRAP